MMASRLITVIILIIIITAIVRLDYRLIDAGIELTILVNSFTLIVEFNEILSNRHVQIWLTRLFDDLSSRLFLREFLSVALSWCCRIFFVVSSLVKARLFNDELGWLERLSSFWFWAQTPLSLRLIKVPLLLGCHH